MVMVKVELGDEVLSLVFCDIMVIIVQMEVVVVLVGDVVKEDVVFGVCVVGVVVVVGVEFMEVEDVEVDFWLWDGEFNVDDVILWEFLDESQKVMVIVGEDGLLDIVVRFEFLQQVWLYENLFLVVLWKLLCVEFEWYCYCFFVLEIFEWVLVILLDDVFLGFIQVRGCLDCGMVFVGDEVLVQFFLGDKVFEGWFWGCVLGVLKRKRYELVFVCCMDMWDLCIMVFINGFVIKIFVVELKDLLQVFIYSFWKGWLQCVGFERFIVEVWYSWFFWV